MNGARVLSNAASLIHALPELVLCAGVLAVLFLGMLRRGPTIVGPAALSLLTLAAAAAATVATAGEPLRLFGGLMARDAMADYFKMVALGATALVALLATRARDTVDVRAGDREAPELYALLLAAALGVHLMAAATDLLTIYLGLELVSVMSYILAGFTRGSRRSAEAALKYVIYGGVASGAFLYGLSILYGLAGSTALASVRVALVQAPPLLSLVALVLCLAGLGYKVAVVPFHQWAPDVYEGAPTTVAAFLSVAPKAGGFALVLRFLGELPAQSGSVWAMLALVLAVVTMTVGNLAALGQHNLKRLLAYSSIAHAGYLFLGVAVGAPDGHRAVLFYLGVYLFMNLAAFGAVVAVAERGVGETLASWAGLGRRMPLVAFVMTVALFALAGMPPTGGFVAKYYLFAATIAQGRASGLGMYYVAALVAVGNSVISLYYYARIMRAMYLEPPATAGRIPLHPAHAVVLVVALVGTLALGLYWAPLDAAATVAVP